MYILVLSKVKIVKAACGIKITLAVLTYAATGECPSGFVLGHPPALDRSIGFTYLSFFLSE